MMTIEEFEALLQSAGWGRRQDPEITDKDGCGRICDSGGVVVVDTARGCACMYSTLGNSTVAYTEEYCCDEADGCNLHRDYTDYLWYVEGFVIFDEYGREMDIEAIDQRLCEIARDKDFTLWDFVSTDNVKAGSKWV